MTQDEKKEAYVRTVLAGNDGDVFSRNDLRQYIAEAWTAGYDEGAYDFGDIVFASRIPTISLSPMTQMQAEKLAEQLRQINEICDTEKGRDAFAEMLLEDAEKLIAGHPHEDLSSMIEICGDKLKLLKLKTNGRNEENND